MLSTAAREYNEQQKIAALAVTEAQRFAARGSVAVAQSVQVYQAAAVTASLAALNGLLAEQAIDTAQDAVAAPVALLTGVRDLAGMVTNVPSPAALVQLVQTMVQDAGRTARAVDQATRPAVTGHVRYLRGSSCGRCAVLAGRVYRYSEGFLRHPKCDCGMMPTNEAVGQDLVTDPKDAFDRGLIHGLSAADSEAIKAGADIGQVVNVRRRSAGLVVGSSVVARAGRLTPQGCLSLASDRAQALELLRANRYIN